MREGSKPSRLPWHIIPNIHNIIKRFIIRLYMGRRGSVLSRFTDDSENGMVIPVIKRKSGITKSHDEKPSQSTCVKHHIKLLNASLSKAWANGCSVVSNTTKQKRSNPLNTSSDSNRCFAIFSLLFR